MAYKDFTQISVWQKAKTLLVSIYGLSKQFPEDERLGLTSDIRRAANSVVYNIAEGYGRFEGRDKSNYYKSGRGSVYKVISQLFVATELKYLNDSEVNNVVDGYKDVITELDSIIKTAENKLRHD